MHYIVSAFITLLFILLAVTVQIELKNYIKQLRQQFKR